MGGTPLPLLATAARRARWQGSKVNQTPGKNADTLTVRLRGIDFLTATTEGTATTAWIKGLRVLSPSKTLKATEGKSVRASAIACGLPVVWCLVPKSAGFCNAEKTPAPHRLPAARHGLTLATCPNSSRPQHGQHGPLSAGINVCTASPGQRLQLQVKNLRGNAITPRQAHARQTRLAVE